MSNLSIYLNKRNQSLQLSYLELRQAIGWLGITLPIVLALGAWLIGDCEILKDSISAYYYTIMGNVLVGVLCGVALFLFSYKGFNNWDWVTSNIAAFFTLGVAFFPMNVKNGECNILSRNTSCWRNNVHYGSAALFFITLACMSLFLFRKSDDEANIKGRKKARNKVYLVCGIVMLVAVASIASLKIPMIGKVLLPYNPVFWFETIALWSFGLSWLTKGEFILKDQ
jgi:hypothetical protein